MISIIMILILNYCALGLGLGVSCDGLAIGLIVMDVQVVLILNFCALGLGPRVFDPQQIVLGCLVMD